LETTDVPGEYGFGDVAYERTSFALRENGKEWVGTAAALWGIAAGVYLTLMGPTGMAELGETLLARTSYARQVLDAVPGVRLVDNAVHLREFVIELSGTTTTELLRRLRAEGIEPGVRVDDSRILVCVTELTSQLDIDHLAERVGAALQEKSA
jgi:glycine dehydrogenase subunit 1